MKAKTINHTKKGFLVFLTKTLLGLFLVCFSTQLLNAQQKRGLGPGIIIECPAGHENRHTKRGIEHSVEKVKAMKLGAKGVNANAGQTAEFIVTFGPGAEANEEAKEAFQFALDIWSTEIVSSVPIRVFADFGNLAAGVLASAGPSYTATSEDSSALEPGTVYPAALANAIAGEVLGTEQDYELTVTVGDTFDFYFGTDGNVQEGQYDFISIALHEIGHGIGFIALNSSDNLDGLGLGAITNFSKSLVTGNGQRLTDLPAGSEDLREALTSDNLFVDGVNAVAALQSQLPKIHAPTNFSQGSSISHWDETVFAAGDPNSLMSPQFDFAESIFDIGDITRGHLKDLGWQLNDDSLFPIAVTELDFPDTIDKGESITRTITVTNTVDREIILNAIVEGAPEAVLTTNTEPITIAPLEV